MPGWWFTIESMTTKHLIHQFKLAIHEALASKPSVRAIMRARSGKQRFPVAQWLEELEKLQSIAIEKHHKYAAHGHRFSRRSLLSSQPRSSVDRSGQQTGLRVHRALGSWQGPGYADARFDSSSPEHSSLEYESEEVFHDTAAEPAAAGTQADAEGSGGNATDNNHPDQQPEEQPGPDRSLEVRLSLPRTYDSYFSRPQSLCTSGECTPVYLPSGLNTPVFLHSGTSTPIFQPSGANTPMENGLVPPPRALVSSAVSLLSVESVVGEKRDFNLQNVSPFFTDSNGEYASHFERKLANLDGENSENQLCIEEFLSRSEKDWFNRYRDAKLGRVSVGTPSSSIFRYKVHSRDNSGVQTPMPISHLSAMEQPAGGISENRDSAGGNSEINNGNNSNNNNSGNNRASEFLLPTDYSPPSGLRWLLLYRIGDWPVYSIILSLGQIIAANSYQITLLNGEVGQPARKLYIVATIYLVSSIIWWMVFRRLKSVYVLSIPFLLYGSAFLFIGCSPFAHTSLARTWVQNIATGLYAFASSSGSIYFALNFGDEGSAPITSWVYRACVVQGSQQIYVAFLWYWGSSMAASEMKAKPTSLAASNPHLLIGIGMGIAALFYAIAVMTFFGLPEYYRQAPGKVPAFYRALPRRKIIIWFFYAVFIQNYWLSAPYGRNWLYLWSSNQTPAWSIVIMVIIFFIGIWALVLWIFGYMSARHAWFIPIFAIGLGCPRWCQMLWGTSNIGAYVPWAGGGAASALVGRGLWLWLGVLDAIQGVGFGMILLNTLTRFHIAFTLLAAQVIGSIGTILARATAPDKIGPGNVFPRFYSGHIAEKLANADFWLCLLFMLSINVLCFMFFRKEQLQKP
ncbi:hypothetical protein MAP00_008908 [Monascus purpureus]|nr:hypothetical protein MAP00_008908 [Monascus purpureus]